jgi:hypothetical protein
LHKSVIGGAAVLALATGGVAIAQIANGVGSADPATGVQTNVFAAGYQAQSVAAGVDPLENPSGIHKFYGYLDDNGDNMAAPPDSRTEPDQNTYLVTPDNPGGPTPGYDYGRHFLIQGHENGSNKAYLTRINLDVVDPAHRVTLLNGETASNGATGLSGVDGSTYDPYTGTLLFTQETGFNAAYSNTDTSKTSGGVASVPLRWSGTTMPAPTRLDGSLGSGSYEGIHPDSQGNVYVVEDASGGGVVTIPGLSGTYVRQPNGFVYRFKPTSRDSLAAGRLQALQVLDNGAPITFHTGGTGPTDDALGAAILDLHSGATLTAKWVTIHDTSVDGTAPFDANATAKIKGATPFKRPENGTFVPGTDFKSFVIAETGDTDTNSATYAGAAQRGAWGALLRLDLSATGGDDGTIKTIELGDQTHNSFDNVTFLDKNTVLTTEDRGDTLHDELNTLDSVWSFDLTKSYADINADAKRVLALGRDANSAGAGSEDNEPTGIFVSDGSTSQSGILGTTDPGALSGVRTFVTQQHGDNITWELSADGANSPAGPKGDSGATGATGAAGATGATGASGTAGTPGTPGTPGAAGPAGPVGPAGPAGSSSASSGSATVTWTFSGPSNRSRALKVRVKTPTSGRLTAALSAKSKGHTIKLGATKQSIARAGAVTLKITVSKSRWSQLRTQKVKHGTLTLTFAPTNGTAGTTTKTVTL